MRFSFSTDMSAAPTPDRCTLGLCLFVLMLCVPCVLPSSQHVIVRGERSRGDVTKLGGDVMKRSRDSRRIPLSRFARALKQKEDTNLTNMYMDLLHNPSQDKDTLKHFTTRWEAIKWGLGRLKTNINLTKNDLKELEKNITALILEGDKLDNLTESNNEIVLKSTEIKLRAFVQNVSDNLPEKERELLVQGDSVDTIGQEVNDVRNILARQQAYLEAKDEIKAAFQLEGHNTAQKTLSRHDTKEGYMKMIERFLQSTVARGDTEGTGSRIDAMADSIHSSDDPDLLHADWLIDRALNYRARRSAQARDVDGDDDKSPDDSNDGGTDVATGEENRDDFQKINDLYDDSDEDDGTDYIADESYNSNTDKMHVFFNDIDSRANDDLDSRANDDLDTGANNDLDNGAKDDLDRGAKDDIDRGANNDLDRGANNDLDSGAKDDFDSGAKDDVDEELLRELANLKRKTRPSGGNRNLRVRRKRSYSDIEPEDVDNIHEFLQTYHQPETVKLSNPFNTKPRKSPPKSINKLVEGYIKAQRLNSIDKQLQDVVNDHDDNNLERTLSKLDGIRERIESKARTFYANAQGHNSQLNPERMKTLLSNTKKALNEVSLEVKKQAIQQQQEQVERSQNVVQGLEGALQSRLVNQLRMLNMRVRDLKEAAKAREQLAPYKQRLQRKISKLLKKHVKKFDKYQKKKFKGFLKTTASDRKMRMKMFKKNVRLLTKELQRIKNGKDVPGKRMKILLIQQQLEQLLNSHQGIVDPSAFMNYLEYDPSSGYANQPFPYHQTADFPKYLRDVDELEPVQLEPYP